MPHADSMYISGHDLHEHHAHASGAFWENYRVTLTVLGL